MRSLSLNFDPTSTSVCVISSHTKGSVGVDEGIQKQSGWAVQVSAGRIEDGQTLIGVTVSGMPSRHIGGGIL
jgi:hypothetical protein